MISLRLGRSKLCVASLLAATLAFSSYACADTPAADPSAYAGLTGNCISEHHWDPGVQGNVVPTAEMFASGVCKISFRADVDDCLRRNGVTNTDATSERRCNQQVLSGAANLLKWNTVGPKLEVEP